MCEPQAGLNVETAQGWCGSIRFADVATLVSYPRMMPWQLPIDVSIDRYASQRVQLEQRAELVFTEVRFLLVATVPGST